MTITAKVSAAASVKNFTSTDLAAGAANTELSASVAFENGTGSGQVNKEFSDTRAVTASSNEDLDLSSALTDSLGNAVVFTAIKAILIKSTSTNAGNLTVGGAASNAFVGPFADAADKILVKPGGFLALAHPGTGWAVTAGTGDLLRIANGGASDATYDILLLGV